MPAKLSREAADTFSGPTPENIARIEKQDAPKNLKNDFILSSFGVLKRCLGLRAWAEFFQTYSKVDAIIQIHNMNKNRFNMRSGYHLSSH
jgi:hypothetical protein